MPAVPEVPVVPATPAPTASPLLSVAGLRYAFGERVAADDVSFTVAAGEVFGLLGPNGAGKTTTISCIAGLRTPHAGTLSFRGAEFSPSSDARARARLGVVPQELALYTDLTARENLEFFGRLFGVAAANLDDAVERALALSGLADRADDRVREYSGGMKRRLNLALGEIHNPELLILDEPTVGVDPQSRNHIFDALVRLKEGGKALLYTTHYMEEAERLCDRIAIMDQGKVLALGTAKELAERAELPGADLEAVFLKFTGKRLRDA